MVKQQLKKDWPLLAIMVIFLLLGMAVYPHLPERVPSHWNVHGDVDGYSGRFFGAFGMPLIALIMYVMFLFLPKIDPKKENYQIFLKYYNALKWSIILFFLLLHAMILAFVMGYPVKIDVAVKFSIGVLFIIMGKYLSKIKQNYFVGVKTPWTLASEEVWDKTHKLAGPLFMLSGLIFMISAFIKGSLSFILSVGSILVFVIFITVYSYLIFKKIGKNSYNVDKNNEKNKDE